MTLANHRLKEIVKAVGGELDLVAPVWDDLVQGYEDANVSLKIGPHGGLQIFVDGEKSGKMRADDINKIIQTIVRNS